MLFSELKSKNQALDPNAIPSQNLPEKPEDVKYVKKVLMLIISTFI